MVHRTLADAMFSVLTGVQTQNRVRFIDGGIRDSAFIIAVQAKYLPQYTLHKV